MILIVKYDINKTKILEINPVDMNFNEEKIITRFTLNSMNLSKNII